MEDSDNNIHDKAIHVEWKNVKEEPNFEDCKTIKTHEELYDEPYNILDWPLGLMKD